LTENGIYYGYAKVYEGDKDVEEMVMSVGYNPFYNNTVRSAVRMVLYSADRRKYTS
jgi:FAD synthase